jgi:uncharacterized lipoprotein YmbA
MLTIICGLVLHGCVGKSGPTTYYTLIPIEAVSPAGSQQAAAFGDVSIGIGPVTFPVELDRQRIVTRSGSNQLEINEFHRWGGSLENTFVQVLTENLSIITGSSRIVAQPWERYFDPDYRVIMDVRRFDGRLAEYASLNATWMVLKTGKKNPLVVRQTIIQEAVADDSYEAFVAAQSAAAAAISKEIAAELQKQIAAAGP